MVQVDETFELAGQPWRAVHQDGTVIVFQHLLDRRVRKLPVAELLADPTYVPHRRSPTPVLDDVAILNGLPVEDARRALWLRHHVHELLYGVPPVAPDADETAKPSRSRQVTPSDDGDPVPNVRYGADVPMGEKVDAKVAELEAAGTPVSERQLRRHMAAYQRLGTAGLVDQRKLRTKTATGRVDARIVELLKEAMQEQTLKSTRSRRTLITRVLVKVGDLNAAGENIPVPSWATLYRTLSGLEGNRHTFGEATTRRTQGNKPDRAYGYQAVARPGELVEIDSTPLDAMVIFPDGTIGRPDVTIAIDVATRTLCANMLLAGATKSADAASILLARTMTPMWMQPGWKETLAYARSILPVGAILGDAELRELLAARPVITPEAITIDRGKVFVGTTFLEACERLQISVTKAAPRTPTDKPHVERAFSAINSSFTESLDGYLGMRVAHRGDDPSPEGLLTLAEVQALLDQWVVQVWQNRPHDGLRHPAIPREKLTPNEMYAAAAAVAPTMNVVLTPDDYVELLPKDTRRPNEYGINFEGLVYDSPGLRQLYRDNAHLLGPDAKLELRYEPYRLNNVWVKDVTNSTWVQVDWRYAKHVHAPFSRDMLKVVKKLTKDRSRALPPDLGHEV
ncbi:Mu transposase C-terminal domain-containing protein [Ornithinimicrobium sp. Y1847]|uniref:Mu transposase C-terminal domain-containing protein n=1 Tax=Ornithinimicrobium sp. Y1847 TaxID=3405419 RepID=UPI003B67EE7E